LEESFKIVKLKQNKNLVLKQGKGQKKMTKKELEFKKLVKAKLSKKQEKALMFFPKQNGTQTVLTMLC